MVGNSGITSERLRLVIASATPLDAPVKLPNHKETGRAFFLERRELGAINTGGPGEVSVSQFPGSHSNLTYLVRHADREYVLRRPPFGSKVKSAHDMGREFGVLSKLSAVYDRAPKPFAYANNWCAMCPTFPIRKRCAMKPRNALQIFARVTKAKKACNRS